ncbi:MAG: histidine ammonia-lyase [Planctomycetota bacterium]
MNESPVCVLDGGPLAAAQVADVARRGARVRLGDAARAGLDHAAELVQACLDDGEPHYGINTGFGSLSRSRVGPEDLEQLQLNLLRSHAAGVGEPLAEETVRAMMVCLAASLARGQSGIRADVVELVVGMLNAGIWPVVPSVGSVGASGDLAPLAHLGLTLIGEGEAFYEETRMAGGEALAAAGLEPISPTAKEGLALINGTHLMAAEAALLLEEIDRLMGAAVIAAAMSIDALRATDAFLDPRVYAARNQPGPASVAKDVKRALGGSQILTSHVENDPRVQDPYSVRCVAYVLGAARDAFDYFRSAVGQELGAVTDNPLVFDAAGDDDAADIISAGNFHGMPIAIPLDAAAIAVTHIAGISERRTFLMLSAGDPESNLTPYLTATPGLCSGLMIAQYTAAACCNEIIGLANPASVANLVTSAGIEDYNSFGPRSAAKLRRSLDLAKRVVAIELLCAAEAIEFHRPLRSGEAVERAHAAIRAVVPRYSKDRPVAPDIEAVGFMLSSGAFDGMNPA